MLAYVYTVFICPRSLASLPRKFHTRDVSLTPCLDVICPNTSLAGDAVRTELVIGATTGIESKLRDRIRCCLSYHCVVLRNDLMSCMSIVPSYLRMFICIRLYILDRDMYLDRVVPFVTYYQCFNKSFILLVTILLFWMLVYLYTALNTCIYAASPGNDCPWLRLGGWFVI